MEIHELTEQDLPRLLGLCERALPLDTFSLELLRRRLADEPDHRPELQLVVREGDELLGAILGSVREHEGRHLASVRLIAVAPEHRRNGIGSRLLAELESRVRADGHKSLLVGSTAPIYFWPGVDVRYTPAYCFFEKHGYRRVTDAINMQVDLSSSDWDTSQQERSLAERGFTIRRLEPGDREQFGRWLSEKWGYNWHVEGLATYRNDPISTYIALRDGRICSFASYGGTAFPYGFGPTGTDPELQGQGLGRVLFHRCMRDMRDLGFQYSEVCWVGPIAFYARVANAWISRVFWIMAKELEQG